MRRLIPIKSFEPSTLPILAVDGAGIVRFANRACADLLAPAVDPLEGRPCWKVARLRGRKDEAFCRRDCPIRREASRGRVPAIEHVMLSAGRAAPHHFDLLSFLVPPSAGADRLILHVLVAGSDEPVGRAGPRNARKGERLHLLTPRELEVLEGLAAGLDAVAVAGRLSVTVSTTRNHIRSILGKLRVHRQVDAILLLLDRFGGMPAGRA